MQEAAARRCHVARASGWDQSARARFRDHALPRRAARRQAGRQTTTSSRSPPASARHVLFLSLISSTRRSPRQGGLAEWAATIPCDRPVDQRGAAAASTGALIVAAHDPAPGDGEAYARPRGSRRVEEQLEELKAKEKASEAELAAMRTALAVDTIPEVVRRCMIDPDTLGPMKTRLARAFGEVFRATYNGAGGRQEAAPQQAGRGQPRGVQGRGEPSRCATPTRRGSSAALARRPPDVNGAPSSSCASAAR